jgi:dethiobiotin synthetase
MTTILNTHQPALSGHYFVTGTDTEIGKTTTTANLVKALAEQGNSVYAIKPVTAGLESSDTGEPFSDDAKRINSFANVHPPIESDCADLLAYALLAAYCGRD